MTAALTHMSPSEELLFSLARARTRGRVPRVNTRSVHRVPIIGRRLPAVAYFLLVPRPEVLV